MNRSLIVGLIAIIAAAGVFYLYQGSRANQAGHNMEDMSSKPVAQSHRSYSFNLLSSARIEPNKETEIKYSIVDDTKATLKDFALDHTKLMHFIVIRDDLQGFQHIHPDFNKETGEFTVSVTFTDNGRYRLFADFMPANGQKDPQGNFLAVTTPKDVNVGDITKFKPQEITTDTQMIKNASEYKLTYTLPTLKAGQPVTLVINVTKNGQLVTDMEEYLGAQAHGILLKKDTLDFAHLHAMGQMEHTMNGQMMTMKGPMSKGSDITFTYTFPSSGIYKLFTQFQHQGKVTTADYTIKIN